MRTGAGWTEENEIGRLWKRLLGYLSSPGCPVPHPSTFFEVHVHDATTLVTGECEVFVGFETPLLEGVPVELCVKVLPRGDYAVITLTGEQMRSEEPVLDGWLSAQGCEPASCFLVQRYDDRFLGLDRMAESVSAGSSAGTPGTPRTTTSCAAG